jgi:hypothetical protein
MLVLGVVVRLGPKASFGVIEGTEGALRHTPLQKQTQDYE